MSTLFHQKTKKQKKNKKNTAKKTIAKKTFFYISRHTTKTSAGHGKFFLSPQSANSQSNFNFFNPQPQVRNCTFKSLVRNRKSATTFQDS